MIGQLIGALAGFFGGFGAPAYAEDSVPEYDATGAKVKPPYITVQLAAPDWKDYAPIHVNVYTRGETYDDIGDIVDAIAAAVGEGEGIPCEGGAVYLHKGRPFCQFIPYPRDPTLKRALLNFDLMAHLGA